MRNSHMAATALCADSGGQLIQFDPVTQGERPSSQKRLCAQTLKSPALNQAEASHLSLSLVVLPTVASWRY